jgi:hypothetical protein
MNIDEFIKTLNEACSVTFNTTECEDLKKILEEAKTAEIRLQYIENQNPQLATESEVAAMILQSPEMTAIAEKITEAVEATFNFMSAVAEAAGNAMAQLVERRIKREEEE